MASNTLESLQEFITMIEASDVDEKILKVISMTGIQIRHEVVKDLT